MLKSAGYSGQVARSFEYRRGLFPGGDIVAVLAKAETKARKDPGFLDRRRDIIRRLLEDHATEKK